MFIGLGGSGGKTLRFLKRDLRRWMDENGVSDEPLPEAWQFLHIDTPTAVDGTGLDPSVVPMLDKDEYLGLVQAGVSFSAVQTQLDGNASLHEEIQTWRVPPAALGVPIGQGAGQFRAIGKTVALTYLPAISRRIRQSLDRLNNARNESQLAQLYTKITGQSPTQSSDIVYVIVSSLAGGTGAGLLLPVSDLLRGLDPVAGGNSLAVLYTPEVFSSLGGAMTGGVQANSLAAISELLNGYWWGGDNRSGSTIVASKQVPSLGAAGVPNSIPQSGPAFPFLVGRTNSSGLTFGNPESLFETVGRTLVAWVVDPVVSDELVAYVIGNWKSASSTHAQGDVLVYAPQNEFQWLDHETGHPNFSGLGFARLTLGLEWFEKYSQRKIAFDALEWAAEAIINAPQAQYQAQKLNTTDPKEIAEAWATEELPYFLRNSLLSELGPDENQIQESLTPSNLGMLQQQAKQTAISNSGINSSSAMGGKDWTAQLQTAVGNALQVFEDSFDRSLNAHIDEWINSAQDRVLIAIEEQMARTGIQVAAETVRQAAELLSTSVVKELRDVDYERYLRWMNAWSDEISGQISQAGAGKIQPGDTTLERALENGLLYGLHVAQVEIVGKAILLIEDFAHNFLYPLAKALEDAQYVAVQSLSEASNWPQWRHTRPPASVCPPQTEFALIDPTEYADLFETMLADSVPTQERSNAREYVKQESITGAFIRDMIERADGKTDELGDLLTLQLSHRWYPKPGAIQSMGLKPQSQALVKVKVEASDFEDRAHCWLNRELTTFGDFLSQSLRSYLEPAQKIGGINTNPAELKKRQSKFISQLTAAYRQADPLVNLNRSLFGLVHPTTAINNPRKVISQIPLEGHPMQTAVETELMALGYSESEVHKIMTTDTRADRINYIDITSFLWKPHSILVIESLTKPIAANWTSSVQSGSISSFWSKRRATRLQEFVPAPQALVHALVRGWLIADNLGLLKRGSKIEIDLGALGSVQRGSAEFPNPTLSRKTSDADDLAVVLESLPLAMVQCSSTNDLRPLLPYGRLRDLGRSKDGSMFEYHNVCDELDQFLTTGETANSLVPSKIKGSNQTERATHFIEKLSALAAGINDQCNILRQESVVNPGKLSSTPMFSGLEIVLLKVIEDLVAAAERYRTDSSSGLDL